ncbi:phosphate ABC transporter substrate-binding protein [Faecalispora anaeroviscerum]|uniref:phosphate ABC transporter substrate-binding protein n=1 Tax=Faecalispora anaeroviscerum TaxID=2991836 RepID=UPI0024BAB510|nr:phosphate ABC transporter substrate-binding protein [Faecalispora anaeroviscerum]
MKQKMMALLAMLLVGATAATGCSSTVEGKSDTSSAAAAQSAASTAQSAASLSGKLTLNGSTSMAKVVQALGEGFMEKYPQVTVEKGGTGSGDAVKAVNNGTALIGDLSRSLKDEEKPSDFEINQIAIDGIAIAVSTQNKVDGLTSEQVAKIYTGEITNWKDVGGADQKITVIGREATSGTRDGFESIFKVKEKTKLSAELSSTGEVVSKVSSDPAAIGYVSLDSVNASVKALKIDGVAASEATVADGTYKVQRPFIEIYKKGSDNELVKAWFEFIKSDEGQQIVKDAGLVTKG